MTIHLSENHEQLVRSLVEGGQYASEADVIDEALRLLEHRNLQSHTESQRVESRLIEGLESGPSNPMTSSDWDEIEREGRSLIAARKVRDGR